MFRRTANFIVFLVIVSMVSPFTLAQSGRGRTPTTPPPTPRPVTTPNAPKTTVLGIPDGGKLTKQDLDGLTSRFALRNGLTVLVREKHSSPLIAINVAVKAGSLSEPDDALGIARLTHKAILRGTEKRDGMAIEKEAAKLGGVLTSRITPEQASFTLIAPAESYSAMVELLADVITHPAFKDDELKKAADEVLLDSKRAQDNPEQGAMDKLFATAFTTHRLKRGSAVAEGYLASVTRQQVQAFYQAHYQPANTIVTVLGDIFTLTAIGQVQLQFGNYKAVNSPSSTPQPAPMAKPAPGNSQKTTSVTAEPAANDQPATHAQSGPQSTMEAAQDRLRYGNARADISQTLITVGYRTPAFKGDKEGLKDLAAMQVLAAVLGLGDGSRLYQGLREGLASRDKQSVANDVSASYQTFPGTGLLIARLQVEPERIDRAEAEYFREIERFRREIISEGELQRAKTLLEKRYFDSTATYESEVVLLSDYQSRFGDWRLFDSEPKRLRAVTATEVQQAAAKYLTPANAAVQEYEPRTALARTFTPEKFAELVVTFAPAAAQQIGPNDAKQSIALKVFAQGAERNTVSEGENVTVTPVPQPVKDFSVLRGPRAYVREDRSLPLLTISVLFQGGRLVEEAATSGTTELMLRSMLKSTTTRKADLIAQELESYGGQLHIVNEPDFFGFTLDVLSRNGEAAVRLLLDIIETPFFGKEEVARERAILLARQLAARDDDALRSTELLWASVYPGHPYSLPRYGLAEAVKDLNEEKLEAWHNKTVKRQYPLVVLVGDTDGSALVSRIFSEGLKRNDLDKTLKVNLPNAYAAPEDKIEQRQRALTTQTIGFRTAPATPLEVNPAASRASNQTDDYPVLSMLAAMAMANRGSADSLAVKNDARVAGGIFFAQVASLPENETKAREALQSVLQRLAAAPPSDDDFEQGRNAAIGRYAIALQQHTVRALEYARAVVFNRKASDVESQPDSLRGVKKADIKRVAEKLNQAGRGVVRAGK
ncbi:MAG: insulinase family protein [Acidobacteriota bacterium]